MEISVRQVSMNPKYIGHLIASGILLVSHLNSFNTNKLAQKTGLKLDECEEILAAIKPKRPHHVMQLSELVLKPFEKISTSISELDFILGGGIKCGRLTEISGEAGAGKSNLCAHIGTMVMLPMSQKGLDASVLLIHTEGEGKLNLGIKRFDTLADSVGHKDTLRKKLAVKNCSNEYELLELVSRLPETIGKIHQNVKLIIIDSITCAFLQIDEVPDLNYYNKRSIKLTEIVKMLHKLAWDKRIAILITNHVSYNFNLGENRPAMGKMWSHMNQVKIYLERTQRDGEVVRYALVTKGASRTPFKVRFRITSSLFDC